MNTGFLEAIRIALENTVSAASVLLLIEATLTESRKKQGEEAQRWSRWEREP